MTAHLVNACQEVDDLLLECLLTWGEVTDQHRSHRHLAPLHRHYAERSARLIEARSAIEIAFKALEIHDTRSESGAPVPHPVPPAGQPAKASEQVQMTEVCRCSEFDGKLAISARSPSRPDWPHRPRELCRGRIRDWNRDILACRAFECGGTGEMALPGVTAERSIQMEETVADSTRVIQAQTVEPNEGGGRVQPVDQAQEKDADDGKQTGSTRPRKQR